MQEAGKHANPIFFRKHITMTKNPVLLVGSVFIGLLVLGYYLVSGSEQTASKLKTELAVGEFPVFVEKSQAEVSILIKNTTPMIFELSEFGPVEA